ncbi:MULTISPECIES: hypothetical protein [Flavobacterium]|uniref:hypothetical protein n=1 Tax=Flavobacterium TaxID=237 RepID=UPI001FCB1997|nr:MULTISPECIES: hypothetical protein [Flavobacterium]UOK41222.1 hypothetical protein LZF87_07775 [Flavobacterium enshiense]
MKKIFFSLIIAFVLISCTDQDDTLTTPSSNTSRDLMFLKVDFQTNAFRGGTEYHFENVAMSPTIPFEETYVPPSDFGSYSLKYIPANTVVFSGTISWMGGQNDYPVQHPSTDFQTSQNTASVNLTTAQYFTPTADIIASEGYSNLNYHAVWDVVKNLEITNQYMSNNAKVGFLLYTPGLGIFQPQNACWFVILYK